LHRDQHKKAAPATRNGSSRFVGLAGRRHNALKMQAIFLQRLSQVTRKVMDAIMLKRRGPSLSPV
jgi:hypothetical protein